MPGIFKHIKLNLNQPNNNEKLNKVMGKGKIPKKSLIVA